MTDSVGDLDAGQAAAVTHPSDRLRISAPPGSGKTRVLTSRVAWRLAQGRSPARTLVVTFTRQAADELKIRLRGRQVNPAQIGTLHGIAYGQLRQRAEETGRRAPRLAPPLAEVLQELRPRWSPAQLAEAGSAIACAAARDGDATGQHPDIEQVIVEYEGWKAKHRVLDFDDLLAAWATALLDDPVFGRAQRWRFTDLYVDEFQDLTPLQFRALSALLDDDTSITVVGDPDQSIYGFNGADPALFQDLPETVPGMTTVELAMSYRCPSSVLDAATRALDRPPVQAATQGGRVGISGHSSDVDEAAEIASLISAERAAGRDPGDIAVLGRTHAVIDGLARRLSRARVPIAAPGERTDDAVTMSTFHSAKGREWPVVILAGVESGLVPHMATGRHSDEDEERRLLYVAMTRASDTLAVTWARQRGRAERASAEPSPWVGHLGALPLPHAHSPVSARPRKVPNEAAERRRRIDEWREQTARRVGCPPDAVLASGHLDRLSTDPPCDLDALRERLGWGPALTSRIGSDLLDILGGPQPAGPTTGA